MWAFGVTMWEVWSNSAEPYAALSNEEVGRREGVATRLIHHFAHQLQL